ncbi:hypothetical protein [Rubripirellula reticaptiva]|uniref:Uncharacterized protein n=1 Tax=Rubripirellula reticaptiva TaxID=2528013 RepID=A0A5C6ES88_9BACT|nr:hypothetical protein [Rubripirellula reticaptiva]TWU51515.1 hypothetical protein Poly59_31070 [Rubripirellula reticaptiva]
MTSSDQIEFCGVAMVRNCYDDRTALRAFVAKHCRHFMTALERRVTEYTVPLTSDATSIKWQRLYTMCEQRDGHVDDTDTIAALETPWDIREQTAVDRVIRDNYTVLPLNRCPECFGLARTPRAQQCPWCLHRWNTADNHPMHRSGGG